MTTLQNTTTKHNTNSIPFGNNTTQHTLVFNNKKPHFLALDHTFLYQKSKIQVFGHRTDDFQSTAWQRAMDYELYLLK